VKLYDASLPVLFIIGLLALGIGFVSSRWLGADNVAEEVCEVVIEEVCGLDIDLTPLSPELPKEGKDLLELLINKNAE